MHEPNSPFDFGKQTPIGPYTYLHGFVQGPIRYYRIGQGQCGHFVLWDRWGITAFPKGQNGHFASRDLDSLRASCVSEHVALELLHERSATRSVSPYHVAILKLMGQSGLSTMPSMVSLASSPNSEQMLLGDVEIPTSNTPVNQHHQHGSLSKITCGLLGGPFFYALTEDKAQQKGGKGLTPSHGILQQSEQGVVSIQPDTYLTDSVLTLLLALTKTQPYTSNMKGSFPLMALVVTTA
ncbi:hypothetical protein VNO77_43957 [Canavalia gladiata]|uniref:Uncharacterized protein n=1 Tax=Canavalia gladiata TaxID=3824 RepID=A0AAN9JVS5_CANGL